MKPLLKLFITSLLVLILVPLIGIKDGNWSIMLSPILTPLDLNILQSIRIPRTLLAFLAGATLSVCGLCFQTIFQNLLATPFTLGITSSASFGASLTILLLSLFPSLALNGFLTPLIGAIGATIVTVVLVSILLNFRFFHSNQTVILLGVVLNIFFSQLISLIQFFASSESTVVEILRWFTGSIPVITNFQILILFLIFVFTSVYLYSKNRDLDLIYIGGEFSITKGVNPVKTINSILLAVSILLGIFISFVGPIGFVGILEPYLCRIIYGSKHKILIPASIMLGGIFLVLSDLVARTIMFPVEIPVGYLTGVIGGVGLILVLFKNKNRLLQ